MWDFFAPILSGIGDPLRNPATLAALRRDVSRSPECSTNRLTIDKRCDIAAMPPFRHSPSLPPTIFSTEANVLDGPILPPPSICVIEFGCLVLARRVATRPKMKKRRL